MPVILLFGALLVPRIVIVFLWLTSDWFVGVFTTTVWPFVGSLFFPYALLWYSVVANVFGGVWNIWTAVVMLIAVLADVGSEFGRYWTAEPDIV